LDQLYRRALALDPLSLSRHAALGEFLGNIGRSDELPAVIGEIRELFHSAESYRLLGRLLEHTGDVDQAIAWTLRARDLEPDNPDHNGRLAELFAILGDDETALSLEPEPGIGLLMLMRRYPELIDTAEMVMIDEPGDIDVRFVLAFAYHVTRQFEAAIHVLSSTGLPDSVLSEMTRSVMELESMFTLISALTATQNPDAMEAAHGLALWLEDGPWWGDISWVGIFRSCALAILERDEEALELLALMKESTRLVRDPWIRDYWCLQRYSEEPVFKDILRIQEERRAVLRERLPATLDAFGVKL
jgi:tetratricopeptide (TPR) repeat protein